MFYILFVNYLTQYVDYIDVKCSSFTTFTWCLWFLQVDIQRSPNLISIKLVLRIRSTYLDLWRANLVGGNFNLRFVHTKLKLQPTGYRLTPDWLLIEKKCVNGTMQNQCIPTAFYQSEANPKRS